MADWNTKVIEEFRANHGKVGGTFEHMELLLLTSTGAKTGEQRVKPVAYTMDGDRYIIVASYGGGPDNPAWYHNLVAHPQATIEVGEEKFPVSATLTSGEDSERLFAQHAKAYPQFNGYKQKTSRHLPVFALERD
jgi:deazaflavin-dependent oxidoreductase (nitroreductase family)